jgi:hypothetical protein
MDIDSIRKAQAKIDADRDALIPKHRRAPIGIHTLNFKGVGGKNLQNDIGVCRRKGAGGLSLSLPPLI